MFKPVLSYEDVIGDGKPIWDGTIPLLTEFIDEATGMVKRRSMIRMHSMGFELRLRVSKTASIGTSWWKYVYNLERRVAKFKTLVSEVFEMDHNTGLYLLKLRFLNHLTYYTRSSVRSS